MLCLVQPAPGGTPAYQGRTDLENDLSRLPQRNDAANDGKVNKTSSIPMKNGQSPEAKKDYIYAIKVGTLEEYKKFLNKYKNDPSAKFHVRLIKKRIQKLNN